MAVYDVADVNETVLDIDIDVTSATDVVGNTQTAGSSVDAFDVNTITPPPGGGGHRYYAPFEPLSIIINDGAAMTDNPFVTLRLTAGSNVERYMVSNNPQFYNAVVEEFNPDPSLTAAVGFLSNINLPVKIVFALIVLLAAVLIYYSREKIGKKNSHIALSVIALAVIAISSNVFGDYSRTELKPWTLSEGEGEKTVYVQYFSSSGYPGLASGVYADSITFVPGLGGLSEEPVLEEIPELIPSEEVVLVATTPGAIILPTRPANLPQTIVRPGAQCNLLITKIMRYGATNDRDQVAKLQTFLREVMGFKDLPTTGYFGPLTDEAVRLFQRMYVNDILLKPYGISTPTGIVARYTGRAINYLNCFVQGSQ